MLRSAVGSSVTSVAVEEHAAFARRDQPGDDVEERGLAAAGRAEQRVGAAVLPDVVEPLQRIVLRRRAERRGRSGRRRRERCAPSPLLCRLPHAGRGGERAERRRRRRTGRDRGRCSPAAPIARSCTPCASATQRSPAKSTWMKLSEPVISAIATVAADGDRVGAGLGEVEMVRAEADRVGAVGKAGEAARRRQLQMPGGGARCSRRSS